MLQTNVVLLSYGSESEYLRTIFCILSFLAWTDNNRKDRLIVYCDNSDFFKAQLPQDSIEYFILTPELLETMVRPTGFHHRIKVLVIDMTFKRFPNQNLLFLDSDTFLINNPKNILNAYHKDYSFMHKREYMLKEGLAIFTKYDKPQYPEALINYISSRSFLIGDQIEVFTQNDYSWNSGVLGLTKDFAYYMKDVLKLTDQFYENSKWFISEQLAFALILQRKTKIEATDHTVLHYWQKNEKILIDKEIFNLFKEKKYQYLNDNVFIRGLTKKWKKKIAFNSSFNEAVYALAGGKWYYGIKKVVQLLFKNPFVLIRLWNEVSMKRKD